MTFVYLLCIFCSYTPSINFERLLTVLEDLADVGLLVAAAAVPLHVGEHPALVGPEEVLGAEEEDGELSDLVAQVLDVGGHRAGVSDLRRPPPGESDVCVMTHQRPHDLLFGHAHTTADTGESSAFSPGSPHPPVGAQFDPDHVLVLGLLPGPAVVAEPAALGHGDVETVGMERRRTRLAAQQLTPWTDRQTDRRTDQYPKKRKTCFSG